MDLLSSGEGTPSARGPRASEVRLRPGPLRDPHFRVAENDCDRLQIVQAERIGVLPPIRRLVRAGDGHVVERALLPLVPPNARGIAEHLAEKSGLTKRAMVQFLDELAALAYREAKNVFTLPGLGKLKLANR